MWNILKYGTWNVSQPRTDAVNALVGGGFPPLAAMILASRGLQTVSQAKAYLTCECELPDPFLLTDMHMAAGRVALAMTKGEKIAVFGDYDVDGITATCLLTDFLRKNGADCVPYIPGRLEEGYGLNAIALRALAEQGVTLIITVDCGITAIEEARLCKELGMDLVITDHHECKEALPEAVAIVDPHRPDGGYPHKTLSGVGVAFKLAAALSGDQEAVLRDYADMVCLGTVADVMALQGENRVFVARGLALLRNTTRPGLAALMRHSGCDSASVSASAVGYMLCPRINAAGRMGKIECAVELFLTEDPQRADALAIQLCEMNRQRQSVESDIYRQAIRMLPQDQQPAAIVLAEESWHQGVVGIVSSRIAEEFCCPTFLIWLDGVHGKASSRSYGGFNLFAALSDLSDLLESYGGHELAAGFTIHADRIGDFRKAICRKVSSYYTEDVPRPVLDCDCAITPELLTLHNIDSLETLEPCGNGCPKPTLVMENLTVERISLVGGGRHMRLRLRSGRYGFNAIYFSATPETASIAEGDLVDVAFVPQVNEFRGERSAQMNITDIRPACKAEADCCCSGYRQMQRGCLDAEIAQRLLPDRAELGLVWRYLASQPAIHETPECLLRKIVRWSGKPMGLGKLLTCLDIFADVELVQVQKLHKHLTVKLLPTAEKADLTSSKTMQILMSAK